jgi:glycosyltransferase involved in cell wall biosynthesis
MACGAPVVASRTPPVTEVIADNENGLLFDFFDTEGLVDKVAHAVENPAAVAPLRKRARQDMVARFDFEKVCLPAQLAFLGNVAAARL